MNFDAKDRAIIDAFESSISTSKKSIQGSRYPSIDQKLLEFVVKAADNGLPISLSLLKEKAFEFSRECGHLEFKSSDGYVRRFANRNNIKHIIEHGEANSVPEELCSDWTNVKLPELLGDYCPDDIFNCDEFGLFYRLSPNKTYVVKGKSFKSGKKGKDRISVLICCNSTGSEKLKPLVIGQSLKPRCFRNQNHLPVIYRNNKTSWMTEKIFSEFLEKLDKRMKKENRNIALVMDNCSSHKPIPLTNIKLVFLPPNATSQLQPLDMGVIHSLKAKYRQKLIRKMLAIFQSKGGFESKDITLYEAIVMLNNSWNEVTVETIQNCFKKCSIGSSLDSEEDNETIVMDDNTGSQDMEQVEECWNELIGEFATNLNFDDYVRIDDNVNITEISTTDSVTEEYIDDDSDDDVMDVDEESVSLNDAIDCLTKIRKFLNQNNSLDESFAMTNKLENNLYKIGFQSKIQSKITDYFQSN